MIQGVVVQGTITGCNKCGIYVQLADLKGVAACEPPAAGVWGTTGHGVEVVWRRHSSTAATAACSSSSSINRQLTGGDPGPVLLPD
jgi:hypothetical protein